MAIDKKNKNGKKELVMLTSIGSVKAQPYTTTVEDHHLIKVGSGLLSCAAIVRMLAV